MSSNSAQIVRQLRHEFQELLDYVIGDQARSRTGYEVELTLFRRLLALGAKLLHLFFVHRAATRPNGPFHAPDGTELEYYDLQPRTHFSVFGKIRLRRRYFRASGQEGFVLWMLN